MRGSPCLVDGGHFPQTRADRERRAVLWLRRGGQHRIGRDHVRLQLRHHFDADVVAYDTSVSGAVQPTAKQSPAGVSGGVAALITASP